MDTKIPNFFELPELTKDNPGVLIKVNGENMLADDYIALMNRHNHWAADVYKRAKQQTLDTEYVIYSMLDAVPYDMLLDYMETRAQREEDKA